MPLTKSAIKKLRKDKKREKENFKLTIKYKSALKKAKKSPTPKNITEAFKYIDKASKNHLIHQNKASRLKSSLSKKTTLKKNTKTSPKSKNKAK